jgi:hypothetical protein
MRPYVKVFLAIGYFLSATPAWAVPEPPSPPGAIELARAITDTFIPQRLEQYEALFAENVRVYDGETLLASNRAEWMSQVRELIEGRVHVHALRVAVGPHHILIAEEVSSVDRRPSDIGVRDCLRLGAARRLHGRKWPHHPGAFPHSHRCPLLPAST